MHSPLNVKYRFEYGFIYGQTVGTHDIYVWLSCGHTLIFMHFHLSHHYSCTYTYVDMI